MFRSINTLKQYIFLKLIKTNKYLNDKSVVRSVNCL